MPPQPLRHTSARVLEFDTVRDLIATYAVSPLGQARIRALTPSTDGLWIDNQQQLAAEIREFRRRGGRFEFSGLLAIGRMVEKARIQGSSLQPTEIRDVVLVIDRAAEWREIALRPPAAVESDWAAVRTLSSAIIDFTNLLRSFRNKILPEGTLDDRASPELARIRREVEKQRRLIQDSLRSYLHRLSEGGAAQDEVVTIRGERFVIPIKAEQKRRVQGVVHGTSSSGQTVFIEPLETIEQNNELVRLLEEEQAEIHRILLEMTRRIGEQADAIVTAGEVLAELEMQFAKARFADDYGCVAAVISPAGGSATSRLILDQARHPVLARNVQAKGGRVVPISVELAGNARELIITGPNTGGKTVVLKTVALLALMAQSGLPVTANRAEFPIFDAVLADIGDYQSIEQNLSTFSAHIGRIDWISREATAESLVLLDELVSATDPIEGAALAVAIADHFRTLGTMTLISTHHTSLKVYGASTPGVLNAAVGFDETTLQPTYELQIGVPGASAGINTAQRLGLNQAIIALARRRLSTEAQDVGTFLDRLHGQLRHTERERERLEQEREQLERERARLQGEGAREQRDKVRGMEKKLESLFKDFEYQAREAVRGIEERAAAQKLSKNAERRMAQLRREFREQFDATVVAHVTGADRGDPHAQPGLVRDVSEGDTVKLKSMGRAASVKRRLDADHFEVEIGSMKMKITRADIAQVLLRPSASPVEAARSRGIRVSLASDAGELNTPSEINVIGHTVDEATRRVEKFLDRAFLAGLPRVRVIHGSGMGILRKALRQYLQNHPHVASVSQPAHNEGGAGATVVELRI
ncbi:MAG: endonuclease MutS2 [Acidobacteria bacterium]|nr:endonuclease MutS2 [Acidobacteriota bacterium]